ncbi:conjugal transfer protein TraG [Methylobacterium variabile]|jgi:type IV secretion system protein VirD4|uniref:Conjugal transfer protein TraG n=1 Tax=Methylobacterium variabile TaxID=298794 RepID=A0A0J6T837_9HYPH|nr:MULTISPECIES: conjugal transfer protein TraG [Methylobacterium]KMO42089.1 conjugal transfer protein TraG [Methylobacterium variabile]NGM37268.1 conjugal transfer protein TraG [Methylobacterium sp. DB0501]UHC20377.1 conjugal transfer protein TraG [Methylobacterium currus]
MKWVYATLIVAIGLALHIGISLFLAPLVGAIYVVEPGHSMMLHAMRVAAVALPALVLFAAAGLTRPGDSGRVVAACVSLFLIGLCAWTVREEIARLTALNPGADARALMRRADVPLFCAVMFAGFVAFITPLVSLVRVKKTTRGYNKPIRSKSAAYGDAEWATMKLAGELFPEDGDLVLGERYRPDLDQKSTSRVFKPNDPKTWGSGGRMPMMGFNCDIGSTHGLVFSGSGGFKTTGTVIPMLLSWPGNAVVLDPSTELHPMLAEYRGNFRGAGVERRVHCITPKNPMSGFNVLDWIGRGETSAENDISAVVGWIATGPVKRDDPKDFFRNSALQLLRGVLAYICLNRSFNEKPRTLRTLRELISEPEPDFLERLSKILRAEDDGSFAKLALGPFKSMTPQTFSGVYATAADLTNWLSFKEYAAIVSDGEFSSLDLVDDDIDVFIAIDLQTLQNFAGLARVIIGGLMNALYHANGEIKDRVAFLLDEAARLGNMSLIEVARDAGRKYGITLVMVYQSLGQLRQQWGGDKDAVSAWFESTAWQSFSAITDIDTAKWLSERCGYYTQELISYSQQARTGGKGSGGMSLSASTSLQKRALIMPDEIITMRRDEQILLVGGVEPIRCGRAIYFRRADMRKLVGANRFHTRDAQDETDAESEIGLEEREAA